MLFRTAEVLFQFFSDRYERASVAVTSNLDFVHWTEVFGNERTTAALLDRLVHRCHILVLEGESFRIRQRLEHHQDLLPDQQTDALGRIKGRQQREREPW